MKYAIVSKENERSKFIANKIKTALTMYEYDEQSPEIVICVGGDGTILYGVHKYLNIINQVKFVGIHTGTLGFFTDFTCQEVDEFITKFKANQYDISTAHLLEVCIEKADTVEKVYALNEMRIENIIRTQSLHIAIDNESFETINGSGVCIATQAGSTAYNRALKGAVVDAGLRLMQMCEITGIHHHLSHSLGNPYIMRYDRKVEITSDNFKDAYLCYDHKSLQIDDVAKISCTTSELGVQFIRYRKYSYLKRLKNLY